MVLHVSLRHRFNDFALDVAFDAPKGLTALFGPSGAGKTTVVNAVAGLMKADHARVVLNDQTLCNTDTKQHVPPHRRAVGYVFQEARLFPHLSVKANLDYGRRMRGLAKDQNTFDQTVEMLGIAHLLSRRPGDLSGDLSGGEKQRIAIGRALLSKPKILLLDEPLAALDTARRDEIIPALEHLRDAAQIPILYVSHSVSEIARLATTVVAMKDGAVVRVGPPEQVFSDPTAAPAIGASAMGALLSARVVAHHPDGLTELEAPGGRIFLPNIGAPVGAPQRVRIRAQDVMLSQSKPKGISALNILSGEISAITDHIGVVLVQINCAETHLVAQITSRSCQTMGLAVGQPIHAIVKTMSVAADR